MTVSYADIETARARLAPVVKPTPLMASATLERMLDARVLIKPENLQKTGSFKIRGAFNRIAAMSAEEKARGVIAASAGNHGQALAWAATRAGVKATIVMPLSAAIAKVAATRGYGQEVVLEGVDYQEAHRAADAICARTGALFVDAYDDPLIVAGQGTVGIEIADEITPDVVLVPVGGGGLLAGVAIAIKERAPKAEVIGVEAAGSPQLSVTLASRAPASVGKPVDTIADGLATGRIGAVPYDAIAGRVTRAITVDDFEIGEAVLLLLERMKLLTEGAGATALAGALKIAPELKGKTVVVVVSGGNIDINLLDRIIGHGLSKMGRLFRFAIDMHDRPGELGKLLAEITSTGANVHNIDHDRTRRDVPIGSARVQLELETRGPEHIEQIRRHLRAHGYRIVSPPGD
jgi:threonine dehydratase